MWSNRYGNMTQELFTLLSIVDINTIIASVTICIIKQRANKEPKFHM